MLVKKNALILIQKFKTFNNLQNSTYDQLSSIKYIGEKIATSITDYFNNTKNLKEINNLKKIGITCVNKIQNELKSSILKNHKIAITGTLTHPRKYYEELIISHQGVIVNTISKKYKLFINW